MKILSWVRTKLRGKQQEGVNKSPKVINSQKKSNEDQFSDWSDRLLLAIGTLGAANVNHQVMNQEEDHHHHHHHHDSAATGYQIQRELVELIMNSRELEEEEEESSTGNDSVSLENYLKQLSCLEKDGRCVRSKKKGLGKKSLSLLINKIFLGKKAAFAPTPSLRDPTIPDNTRMEKILRTLMQKKIYPQNSSPNSNANKYLENRENEQAIEREKYGSKWVKTDSEYIVLEI